MVLVSRQGRRAATSARQPWLTTAPAPTNKDNSIHRYGAFGMDCSVSDQQFAVDAHSTIECRFGLKTPRHSAAWRSGPLGAASSPVRKRICWCSASFETSP